VHTYWQNILQVPVRSHVRLLGLNNLQKTYVQLSVHKATVLNALA